MVREVVVTGGGTGIGYAVAERFAASGDAVTITGRRAGVLEKGAARLGVRAAAFDASDPEAVSGALEHLPERVDVLVNNAGANRDFAPPAGAGLARLAAAWRRNIEANLMPAVLVTAALAPRFADGARIVTLGSTAARQGGGSYAAAKAALEPWNHDVARQFGRRGITANIVAPGLVLDTEFFGDVLTPELTEQLAAATRTGRAGSPRDVAALVEFLASPDAGHITGETVYVKGGAPFEA